MLAVVVLLVGVSACSGNDPEPDPVAAQNNPDAVLADGLPRLHAMRGDRPGVFDENGRQVLLRAVNLNFLANYAQNNPDLEPTHALTGDVWDQIAAEGFNAVRLLVSWSWLEPVRGEMDEGYVEQIRQAVRDAANRGLYTVIDMHQDAWGPFVTTPDGTQCPAGREPSNGWDGAPQWATPSPSEFDSCRSIEGENKPGSDLVTEAWDRFYDDTDGVQSRLVAVWGELAEALADEWSVAGYDLLNEPGAGWDENAWTGLLSEFAPLGEFYSRAIEAIRAAESDAAIEPRPIFFEPTVAGNPVPPDFSDDPGLVFAPHLYGGSIAGFITVDQHWSVAFSQAAGYETSLWAGEYGWWDDPAAHPELVGRVARFVIREDGGADDAPDAERAAFVPVGGAWWQWAAACGDPHRVTSANLTPEGDSRQYRVTACPSDEDQGVVPDWRTLLTRPFPRFAPGWITGLVADGAFATLELQAEDAEPGTVVELWVPGESEPQVGGSGIAGVESTRSGRGWRVVAEVCAADYVVNVGSDQPVAPTRCD